MADGCPQQHEGTDEGSALPQHLQLNPATVKGLPTKSRGAAEDGDAFKKPAAEGLKGPVWGQLPSRRPRPNSFV